MRIGTFLRVFGLVLCCVAVVTQSCRREPQKKPPDEQTQQPDTILEDMQELLVPTFASDVKDWLGNDLFTLVSAPETITSYRIMPKKDASSDQIAGYPIVQRGPDLTQEQRIQLQWLLLDQQSYRTESVKKCLFLPEYAFTLHKGDAALTVLLADSCPQIKFLAGDKTLLRDCDPALPKFQQLLEHLFPETSITQEEPLAKTARIPEIFPAVAELLSSPALDALADPENVTAYQIFPKKQAADTTLHGYPILKRGPDLTPEHVAEFQSLVLTDSSYRFESVGKCLFLPEYAFLATRGDTEVTLLCDVNCGQVKFLVGDQTVFVDWQKQGMASLRILIENVLATP